MPLTVSVPSNFWLDIAIGGQYRGTKVPRYFFGTGTVGTFVVPVPVPPNNSKVPRYRTGTLVFFFFFSTDFKNVPLKT